MFRNQFYGARQLARAGIGVAGLLVLGGCSLFHQSTGEPDMAAPAPVAQPEARSAPEPRTANEGPSEPADEPADEPGTATVLSDAGPEVKPNAPKNYVVRRGDTLWGIANMFLRDPWHWPEIWYLNPDIHNPHLIYPGDTVRLALRSDGHTALQVVRGTRGNGGQLPETRLEPMLRSSPLEGPIATIPYSVIAAFLSRPGVLTTDEVKQAPYILALADDHQIAGTGHELYVKKLDGDTGARYSVMHIDEPLVDPDSGHQYGNLAIYSGTAQLTQPGRIAKLVLTDSARETLQGDVLVSEDPSPTTDFVPRVPAEPVSGRVMAVVDNVLLAGQFEVVAINRGAKDGLERGSVLTVDQVRGRVTDQCAQIEENSTCWFHPTEKLPSERAGTLLVFKTDEFMSYALIISEIAPIHVEDHVRNP